MNRQRVVLFLLLAFIALTCQVQGAVGFPWGCSNYSGTCRPACLPQELPFGPFGCAKGFVCCVSHIL
ncbi:beta-defensin-like 1 [Amia ocellicauda]|uniref:beta-defensin-like 1 n=1 Tax=Amia ocellicauda TaxID=2972642 RepID=UPI0034644365